MSSSQPSYDLLISGNKCMYVCVARREGGLVHLFIDSHNAFTRMCIKKRGLLGCSVTQKNIWK